MKTLIALRDTVPEDLSFFFEHQRDPEANHMAAFTAKNPTDRDAFEKHWAKIMADPGILIRTIIYDGQVTGYVLTHGWFGDLEVTYWVGKEFWGMGIATDALGAFLKIQTTRPLFARGVHDNHASIRVLEKCGFVKTGMDIGYSNARQMEVEEVVMKLAT